MDVVSRFAIRMGAVRTSHEQSQRLFRTTRKRYTMQLNSADAVAILASKRWHNLQMENQDSWIGRTITFEIRNRESLVPAAGTTSSKPEVRVSARVQGRIVDTISGRELGQIDSTEKSVTKSSVAGYLTRHAKPAEEFSSKSLGTPRFYQPQAIRAPTSNALYSVASKDINPIHTNPYAVAIANLPDTIVHGMYTSAQGRRIVQSVAAAEPGSVARYEAQFTGMVMPGATLVSSTKITGLKDGRKLVRLELRDSDNDTLVMKAHADVEQPLTAFLFTGQGSAVQRMGMDLYDSSAPDSPVRKVWDEAERFFQNRYGLSILQIVRNNPHRVKVSLNGPKGMALRENYARLKADKHENGRLVSVPLFPEALDPDADTINFHGHKGLLFETQFAQPCILLMEKAAYEDMKAKGAVPSNSYFAGHSLGEYAALGCLISGFSVASLAEVVFLRGLTMQSAVPRDPQGRSRYGMVAVSPARVAPWFTSHHLSAVIQAVDKLSKSLLQTVNYNVEEAQYVVAGSLVSLEALRVVLEAVTQLHKAKPPAWALVKAATAPTELVEMVQSAVAKARQTAETLNDSGYIPVGKGTSIIPLQVDVPFHSRLLLDGVHTFRRVLQNHFRNTVVRRKELEERYVPNLLGIPFRLTKDFLDILVNATDSPIVKEWLSKQHIADNQSLVNLLASSPDKEDELCTLTVIELLSYQFASPVQWIDTQRQFFTNGVKRYVEVGPSPVLAGMVSRSAAVAAAIGGSKFTSAHAEEFEVLWSGRATDVNKLLGEADGDADEGKLPTAVPAKPKPPPSAASIPTPNRVATVQPIPATVPHPVASAAPSAPVVPAARVPFSAVHSLQVIVALKLRTSIGEIKASDSIKTLCGGKSAIQNEIIGDLAGEFKSEVEGADSLPLTELGSKMGSRYTAPGALLSSLIAQLGSRSFPGGFGVGKAREYYAATWGFDADTSEGCLVHALVIPPSARLGSDAEAFTYLDEVAASYGKHNGVGLSKPSAAGVGGGASSAAGAAALVAIDPKEMQALKMLLRRQNEALAAYLNPTTAPAGAADASADTFLIETEHGPKYIHAVMPLWNASKIRRFDSYWNWARQQTNAMLTRLQKLASVPKSSSLPSELSDAALRTDLYLLGNRAPHSVVPMLANRQRFQGPRSEQAEAYAQQLQKVVESQQDQPPVYLEYATPSLPITRISKEGKLDSTLKERYPNHTGYQGYVEDLTSANNPNRLQLLPAFASVDEERSQGPSFAAQLQDSYVRALQEMAKTGISFKGKTALITGGGKGSIGIQIARCLLLGGCHVITTTRALEKKTWDMFKAEYRSWSGRGGKLTVLPFNAASQRDVESVVNHMFLEEDKGGLGLAQNGGPDFVIPFAALSENGRDIGRVDDQSEVAHRIMLTNVVRLLGSIKNKRQALVSGKDSGLIQLPPCAVILPCSPNHGIFGGDGLYAESKLGLESLFAKWLSEGWGPNLNMVIIGGFVGWCRGTGLMNANDLIAAGIESSTGLRTFDTIEMAFSLVGLLHPRVIRLAQRAPVKADLTGGFLAIASQGKGLPAAQLRKELLARSALAKAVYDDERLDNEASSTPVPPSGLSAKEIANPRARLELNWPSLPDVKTGVNPHGQSVLNANSKLLQGLVDLSKVVVVVGYGEVGPYGSSRTRWEYELYHRFTREGAVELARSMKLVKFVSGGPDDYVGWADVKTSDPVADGDIWSRYGEYITKHIGIREIEPALFDGYDPKKKVILHQIAVEADMPPFECSKEELSYLQTNHGSKLESFVEEGRTMARLKKGAVIYVPKTVAFDRVVAGQIPTGWNPALYGIPSDIKVAIPIYIFAG